ncbi:galanin receptor type 2-like [Acanthaster planci]|uniref:Galanin receptor type 2-like n=1 Tax=Acanthaster planci TaxID=133434 RepID=A0A8B7Z693_ACAPL|nr:galanin receptor type 2-like [Acanthaster planci]
MQWKVIKTLRRQVRALSGRVDLNPADRRRVWQLRATQVLVRTLLAFGVTFSVCWIPDQSMYLLYNFGFDLSIASTVRQFGIILGVCNSCINPIIYTMTNQQFRKGVMVAFSGKRTARVGDATTTMQLAVISARTEGIPGHMTSP